MSKSKITINNYTFALREAEYGNTTLNLSTPIGAKYFTNHAECAKEGFFIQEHKLYWLNATHGIALKCRHLCYKYWKSIFYPQFETLANKGEYTARTNPPMLSEGAAYFLRDGFQLEFQGNTISTFSWQFATHGKARQLRLLVERKGVDRFLPFVKKELELSNIPVRIAMKVTSEQIKVLKEQENILAECVNDTTIFSRLPEKPIEPVIATPL